MNEEHIGFFSRLAMALVLPWKLLANGRLAARIARSSSEAALPDARPQTDDERPEHESEPAATAPSTEVTAERILDDTPALQLLAILQREGRLIDFLNEDVTQFSDAEIGAAARVVHAGCQRGLKDYVEIAPVRTESEGDSLTLEAGFDASRVRLTGNVVGEPPYVGRLAHPGWVITRIALPTPSAGLDVRVIAPAEVELG